MSSEQSCQNCCQHHQVFTHHSSYKTNTLVAVLSLRLPCLFISSYTVVTPNTLNPFSYPDIVHITLVKVNLMAYFLRFATLLQLSSLKKAFSTRISMCVHSSCFYKNLNISFIYKDIFTKFARNVYDYKNLSVQNFSIILKNKIATCLKIIQVL